MGVTSKQVDFENELPTSETITEKLREVTGLEIYCKQWSPPKYDRIFCADPDWELDLTRFSAGERRSILLSLYDFGAGYLFNSTILVLVSLGGTCPYELPNWVGLSWKEAEKYFS